MNTYPTYQAAKIANPDQEIKTDNLGNFFVSVGHTTCNPADYCMTNNKFLVEGNKIVAGDIVLDESKVVTVKNGEDIHTYNSIVSGEDATFILKAKALEEIKTTPTETLEEKEVLDAIETKAAEGLELIGGKVGLDIHEDFRGEVEQAEWNGEGLPPVGVECECFDFDANLWVSAVALNAKTESGEVAVASINESGKFAKLFWGCKFRKPESPEAKKEREELEAAYDLYVKCANHHNDRFVYDDFVRGVDKNCPWNHVVNQWVSVVKETGYRKGE